MNIFPPQPALRVVLRYLLTGSILSLLVFSNLSAQSRRAYIKAGDAAYGAKDYAVALQHYTTAMSKSRQENPDLLWKYAESARQINAWEIAKKAYTSLSEDPEALQTYPLVWYRLAESYQVAGKYKEASAYYDKFITQNKSINHPMIPLAEAAQSACGWADAHQTDATTATIKILDKKVNSPYSDFGAFAVGDTLYYSSYRFEQKGKTQPKLRQTRPMMSIKGKQSRELSRTMMPIPDSTHVAHMAFTPHGGHHIIFTQCKNLNAQDIRCELWMTTQDMKGRWGKPMRLPEPINQKGFTTTHPYIGTEAATGQTYLWFASDRLGGKGKLDLWQVPLDTNWFCPCNLPIDARKPHKLPEFDAPTPIAAINTPDDDVTPYYSAAQQKLYFSSKGWTGFGGFDVFSATLNADLAYGTPVNVGPVVNSSHNDLYYWLRTDGYSGYLSSNRPGSQYLDPSNKSCCNDIFEVKYAVPPPPAPPEKPTELVVKTGAPPIPVVTPPLTTTPSVQVPPPPTQLTDFVGLPLYFDNDEPDKRTRKATTNKSYEETVLAYLDRQEEYTERFSAGLPMQQSTDARQEVNTFFENEVRTGYDRLDQLCELLQERLEQGMEVEILIKGFTSPRAESDYNLQLGRRRISSVRNHIMLWDGGTLAAYFQNGRLKVSETSFGETTVRAGISDDLRDERNSIYDPRAARERRVEIVEIRSKQR
jgi:outer membrane protein OmpA-like peptidoglycan-associated protein